MSTGSGCNDITERCAYMTNDFVPVLLICLSGICRLGILVSSVYFPFRFLVFLRCTCRFHFLRPRVLPARLIFCLLFFPGGAAAGALSASCRGRGLRSHPPPARPLCGDGPERHGGHTGGAGGRYVGQISQYGAPVSRQIPALLG